MKNLPSPRLFAFLAGAVLCVPIAGLAQTQSQASPRRPVARIAAAVDDSARVPLVGSHSPRTRTAKDIGAVAADMKLQGITLVFSYSAAQQQDLDQLLAAQQDPSSPLYHQWLTPAQFGARFGMADSDIATVEAWLQSHGFTVEGVSNSRTRITFSGTAGQVAQAFGTSLHNYTVTNAAGVTETHFAPSTDLSLPAAFAGSVAAVTNLSSFHPHSHVVQRANFTSAQTGSHYLTPGDIATIYDIKTAYNAGYTGAGQSIAVTGQSAVYSTDISNFLTAAGLAVRLPSLELVPNSGTSAINPLGDGDEVESDLDIEWSSAIATGASIIFVYTGSNTNYGVADSWAYAIDNDVAPIITSSYGNCEVENGSTEVNQINAVLAQAAAQGQTFLSAAGDSGSSDCYGDYSSRSDANYFADNLQLAVDFPASSPYVLAIGGTEFPTADTAICANTYFSLPAGSSCSGSSFTAGGSDVVASALSYIPEQVWNDDAALASAGSTSPISSGGGGASIYFSKPSWQAGTFNGVAFPTTTQRLVPDVSLDASLLNAAYLYCSSDSTATGISGSCSHGFRDSNSLYLTDAGGTSFSTPIFAAMLAIINQARGYSAGQGLVNPTLYTLAANSTTYANAFHDITIGGNQCLAGSSYCGSGTDTTSFAATLGYDEASGLGSIDLDKLLLAWPANATPAKSFTVAAGAVTATPGTNATSTITITPTGGYTGTVRFYISSSNTIAASCYSIPNATVTGATAATSTLTLYTNTASCASGTNALAVGSGTLVAAASPAAPVPAPAPRAPAWPLPAAASLAGILALAGLRRRGLRLKLGAALSLLLLIGVAGLSGCGSSASGSAINGTTVTSSSTAVTIPSVTPAGTYTVTVTAVDTSNVNLSASTTFTLTVN